jgi:hypothetical protein
MVGEASVVKLMQSLDFYGDHPGRQWLRIALVDIESGQRIPKLAHP